MNKYITNELIENTYLFCVKRVADSEAAQDLSQDILYEALRAINRGKSFQSFHSWYWRMARNKYAEYVSYKQNPTMMYVLPEETVDYSVYDSFESTGWSNLHQQFLTTDYGKLEYVNDFECEPFPDEGNTYIHGRDNWVNGNNISLLLALSRNPHKELNSYEEEMVAEFIKNGLLKKSGDSLIVQFPILKRSVAQQIYGIVWEAVRELLKGLPISFGSPFKFLFSVTI